MTRLRFTDGVEFNTSGPLRTTRRCDGWYVVGHGMLIPCADEAAADALVVQLAATRGSGNAG